jgi:hypothetical protein
MLNCVSITLKWIQIKQPKRSAHLSGVSSTGIEIDGVLDEVWRCVFFVAAKWIGEGGTGGGREGGKCR